ncbi:MAG: alanine racemase [Deltaproteobacteria bacterium]|nr:alanine racemase [Deltaproteobacteria bacterium]MCB9785218.1 alanine racemase [Deltaproteobacteria bacterium]
MTATAGQARADWERWRRVLRDEALPAAVLDLDAVDRNLAILLGHMGGAPITMRPASKSVRVPWLLRHILEAGQGRLRGLMTYAAGETELLADQGFDDLLLAYPVGRRADADRLARLAARGVTVRVAIDHADHVRLLEAAAADAGTTLAVCIDVDVSWRPLGGRAHLGVRRSPIRSAADAVALGRHVAAAPHLRLDSVLAYEAQVAGIRERNPGSRHLDPVRRLIKARSVPLAASRRAEVVAALRADGHAIELVNGGGTGSVASTSRDPTVTELTAGSGLVCSHLFDGYRGLPLEPALWFALAVVRRSDPDHVTCGGGGYVASGPAGADRLPVVDLPPGLEPLPMEGFGEVQTPFRLGPGAPPLELGDPVLCRHAKAGELAERFSEYLIVRGEEIVDRAPTLRGQGGCFL